MYHFPKKLAPNTVSKIADAPNKGILPAYHKFIEKQKAKALKQELKIKAQQTEVLEKKVMDIGYHERLINLSVYANPFSFRRSNYTTKEITDKLENR